MQIIRPLVIALLVSFFTIVQAPSAHAAQCFINDPCYFDITSPQGGRSGNNNPGGSAKAKGQIYFTGVRTVVVPTEKVVDICNSEGTGDGLGAYLYIDIKMMNGTVWELNPRSTPAKDVDGCSNGSFYTGPGFTFGLETGRIDSARAVICECDGPLGATDWGQSNWKDNPFT